MLDQDVVDILSTKMGVAHRGKHGEVAIFDCHDRDVQSPSTEVIYQDLNLVLCPPLKAVGHRGGSWLIDDVLNVETGNGGSILSRLLLLKVEVGGYRDDCIRDLRTVAAVRLSNLFHML